MYVSKTHHVLNPKTSDVVKLLDYDIKNDLIVKGAAQTDQLKVPSKCRKCHFRRQKIQKIPGSMPRTPLAYSNYSLSSAQKFMTPYRRIFVYIFCVISICTLVFTRATKSLVVNIERTSQN